MTRKRKVPSEENATCGREGSFNSNNSKYGYNNKEEENSYEREDSFNSKYGYVEGAGSHYGSGTERGQRRSEWNEEQNEHEEVPSMLSAAEEDQTTFPTQLVSYLHNMKELIEAADQPDPTILERCAEECSGHEEQLLSFHLSCTLVESIFCQSISEGRWPVEDKSRDPAAACRFLQAICRLKKKRILALFFSGSASKVLEKLLNALDPATKSEHVEMISKLSEIVAENWMDVCYDQKASFIARAILKVCCQPGQEVGKKKKQLSFRPWRSSAQPILQLLSDYATLRDHLSDARVSLVVQEGLGVEEGISSKESLASMLATSAIEYANREGESGLSSLHSSWEGRNSSRVWEKIVSHVTEEKREELWQTVCGGGVASRRFFGHQFAFFPLQALIRSVKSFELATDVLDELGGNCESALAAGRPSIVSSLIECSSRHEGLHKTLLISIRRFFNANKASNKDQFLVNLLTWNNNKGDNLALDSCCVHGSVLLESLLSMKDSKLLCRCLAELPKEKIREMAEHRVASHVLQSFLKADNEHVSGETKLHILKAFQADGGAPFFPLLHSPSGSFVFESLWKCSEFSGADREKILKTVESADRCCRRCKCVLLSCDVFMFRKNRKGWLAKWSQAPK